MITETFSLKESTKTVYVLTEKETSTITEQQLRNITSLNEMKFFRRLGGSETITRGYTCRGYLPICLISKNPNKTIKKVRTFIYE